MRTFESRKISYHPSAKLEILATILLCFEASAAVVAAENLPPGPMRNGGESTGVGGLYGNGYYPGVYFQKFKIQTFTAGESGMLHSVSLVVQNHFGSRVGSPLVVSLVSILGDAATPSQSIGEVLATAYVQAVDIELAKDQDKPYRNDYNIVATYDTGLELVKGQKYGVRVGTVEGLSSQLRIWLPDYNYQGGVLLQNEILGLEERSYGGLFFKVMVMPVPEPGVPVLAMLGLISIALIRRRHLDRPQIHPEGRTESPSFDRTVPNPPTGRVRCGSCCG